MEYLHVFLQHYYFWNDSLEIALLLNYSSPQLGFVFEMCISLQRRNYYPKMFTNNIYVYHIKSFKCRIFAEEVINGFHEG